MRCFDNEVPHSERGVGGHNATCVWCLSPTRRLCQRCDAPLCKACAADELASATHARACELVSSGVMPGAIELDGELLRLRAAPSLDRMPSAFSMHARAIHHCIVCTAR